MDLSAQSSRADAAETASAVPSLGHGSSAGARHAESASASAAAPAGLLTSPSMPQLDVDNKPSRKSSFVADPAAEAPAYHPPVYHGCGFRFRARIYTPTHDQFSLIVFSAALAPMRREYFIIVCRAVALITVLMWATLPM